LSDLLNIVYSYVFLMQILGEELSSFKE